MNRLSWYLARRQDHLSLLTVLAWLSVLLLIAAMFWLFSLLQLRPAEQNMPSSGPEETVTLIMPEREAGHQLLTSAPKLVQVTQAIETLYQVAAAHQLSLQEVVYQDQQTEGETLVIYAIDFNVQQAYPQLKEFLIDLLAALPYLALEQVSFERKDIAQTQIQSHFRFKLFLEREHE
jgi:hypothetical protein